MTTNRFGGPSREVRVSSSRGPKGLVIVVLSALLVLGPAGAAGPEYVLSKPITAQVGDQSVALEAGASVDVMGVTDGKATIRVALPNGSFTVIQTPVGNLQRKAPPAGAATPPPPSPTPTPAVEVAPPAPQANGGPVPKETRTKAEVDALMDAAGKTKPTWWGSASLKYPPTLDLTWTKKGGGPGKDFGAFLWNTVAPNPAKWEGAIKLLHDVLQKSKGDSAVQNRAEGALAATYTEMLSDYERGGFWAKRAGNKYIILATCYLKLGCPSAAAEVLRELGSDSTRNGQAIKLWADLGDLQTSLKWAEEVSYNPTMAYLAAGDACRLHNKIPEAIEYYEKVLAVDKKVQRDDDVNKKRAAANIEAIKLFDALDLAKIADGTYTDSSIGYSGQVEVSVTVKDHMIKNVKIGKHKEKQFYSSLTEIPPLIIEKQSVKGIPATTGATVTAEAIVNATAKALAAAQE